METLLSKYSIDVWSELPRNKKYSFKIVDVDIDDLVIAIQVGKVEGKYSHMSDVKTYRLKNLDEFYSFLYNYRLFKD